MHRWLRFAIPLLPLALVTAALAQPAPVTAPSAAAPAPAPTPAVAAGAPDTASGPAAVAPPPQLTTHAAPAVPAFPVEEQRLANGLQVLLAPDTSLPNVTIHVTYHVGFGDEPQGLSGIAHLVEHMTYEGSRHVQRGAMLRLLSNAGATDLNGATGADTTRYYATVPPERLELALWLESDRMGYFLDAASEATLAQERSVVQTELRTRFVDATVGLVDFLEEEETFPSWHPYHLPSSTWAEDLERISLADIRAFFTTWYGPGNATLILAGNFDRVAATALVQRYFGSLPARPAPARPELPALERNGATRVEVAANVTDEYLELTWITPAFLAPGDAALDWVAMLLSEGEAGRLQKRLVAGGLAQSVNASQRSRRAASLFAITALAQPGVHAEQLREAIDQELARLAASGPTPPELSRARSFWIDTAMFSLQTGMGRAARLSSVAGPEPLAQPFDWLQGRDRGFSAAEVRTVVDRYLLPAGRAAEILVRPRRTAPVGGVVVQRSAP